MKKIYFIVLLSLLSFNLIAADAGWINRIDGTQNDYSIKRGNENISATVFTVLQVGDSISANNAQHSIELYLNGGKQLVKVNQHNSPFIITEQAKVPDTSNELWAWIKQRFSDWQQFTKTSKLEAKSGVSVRENSAAIKMPLLSNIMETSTIIATDRILHLQWNGGKLPYTVKIKKRQDSLVSVNSSSKTVKTDTIKFDTDSSYRIEIVDSAGKSFIGGFKTAEIAQMPIYKTILTSNLPTEVSKTLQAIWLATQNNGEWVFEAYQQIAPLNYQPAQLLKEALARGKNTQKLRGIRG